MSDFKLDSFCLFADVPGVPKAYDLTVPHLYLILFQFTIKPVNEKTEDFKFFTKNIRTNRMVSSPCT